MQLPNRNLQAVGKMITSFAGTIKGIGFVLMAMGPISILWGFVKFNSSSHSSDSMGGMGLGVVGVVLLAMGLMFWVASVFMAAAGEVLLSLVSIEANIAQMSQTVERLSAESNKGTSTQPEKAKETS